MSSFSKNLQRALSINHIKQVDFAYSLGLPPTTVSGWMRGAHEPSIDTLLKVCDMLNIPVQEMVVDKNHYVDRLIDLKDAEETIKRLEAKGLELSCRCADLTTENIKLKSEMDKVQRAPKDMVDKLVDTGKVKRVTVIDLK